MKEDNYYRTRSLPLAEFLYVKGHSVEGIDTVGQAKETEYMFKRTPGVEQLAGLYRFAPRKHPDLSVPVREFQGAQRELHLLNRMHQAATE